MGITYGSHDLVKRMIHLNGVGYNVEKVIYNDNQIWPSSPQPTYHIMGDFTQGSLPSGWSSSYGGVSYSNDGISLDPSGGTDYVTIKNQNSLPSLENASRVKIDYDFYRTGASTQALYPYLRLQGGIYENLYDRRSLQSSVFFNSPDYAAQEWHTVDTGSHGGLSFELGKYTLSIDVDLMNGIVTQTITSPNQTTATISRDDVHIVPNMEAIRHSDEFRITLFEGITMSDMNMYIWYMTPPTPANRLCFTANTAGSTVKLRVGYGSPVSVQLEISRDKNTRTSYTIGDTITLANVGDKVYFRNTSSITTGFSQRSGYYNFVMSGSIAGSGDVTTLIRDEGSDYTVGQYCFVYLFYNCSALTSAPELPSHILTGGCYEYMFRGCTSLVNAPSLPATTLTQECYYEMFRGCTSLITAPELPATTMQLDCYNGMFRECSSLITAPELPATTLASYCYCKMFGDCTSLVAIPNLPATTLANSCYFGMFEGCTNIKLYYQYHVTHPNEYRIPTSGTGTLGTLSLTDMFTNTGGEVGTPSINTTYYTGNVVPVQPTYHVISDFTQGSLPSDYTITEGSAIYTSNGISVDTSGGTGWLYMRTNNSSSFPSLKNSTKIRIDLKFYWDVTNSYAMSIILNSRDWVTINKDDARFDSSTPGVYSFSRELDLQTYTTKLTMTTPLGVTTYATEVSTDSFVWYTRESTSLTFRLFSGMALSDVDVYVWESNVVYVSSISNIGTITTSPGATVTQTLSYSPNSANSSANLWVVIRNVGDWVVSDSSTRLINGNLVLTISTKDFTGTESFNVVNRKNNAVLGSFTVNSV